MVEVTMVASYIEVIPETVATSFSLTKAWYGFFGSDNPS